MEENDTTNITTWTPQQAADETGVSRTKIMRMISNGELPGAKKINGKWAIPVTDLGAAGLSPGQPKTPDADTGLKTDHNTDREQSVQIALLTAQLETERAKRLAAEQLATERLARVDDLNQALRDLRHALPPGRVDNSTHFAESQPVVEPSETTPRPEPKGFFRRLFS
ncbi:helix-turn-helix domain-containing protein [Corynebacterium camporealensis]